MIGFESDISNVLNLLAIFSYVWSRESNFEIPGDWTTRKNLNIQNIKVRYFDKTYKNALQAFNYLCKHIRYKAVKFKSYFYMNLVIQEMINKYYYYRSMYYFIHENEHTYFYMAKLGGDAQQQQPDFTVFLFFLLVFFFKLNSTTASAYMYRGMY